VPDWLLTNPTPVLRALLDCTGGYALSADGVCCLSKQQLSMHLCTRLAQKLSMLVG
jgi:hypothetical protein